VNRYGADAVRAYLMFGWRWEQGGPWDNRGIEGMYRFLNRLWELSLESVPAHSNPEAEKIVLRKTHQTIAKASREIETFSFNTYLASLMELLNVIAKYKGDIYGTQAWTDAVKTILLLIAPACPHFAEEVWNILNYGYSIHNQDWPVFDPQLAAEDSVEIVIQVNGKIRGKMVVPVGGEEEELKELALNNPDVQKHLAGKSIRKAIVVPDRLVNIVVG
jgi:leucyl-tRNA synthetase